MTDTKAKLAAIYNADPEGFERIVTEFLEKGPSALWETGQHPRHRTDKRKKRTPSTIGWIWAAIEFIKWRDDASTTEACKRLEYFYSQRGKKFRIYQTDDYTWRKGREPEPDSFEYPAPDWQGLRKIHNEFDSLDDDARGMGELKLNMLKASEDESALVKLNPENHVPGKPEDL